ncbi:unnamed protein product [Phytophthora lilii]|uniref:Unnamed protein product n=1 Tax=Phytophthora lilii TaxID=2077276 RepID=A0A9W6WUJ7_9STRA|nr:unnamed protein product [Phytophthora lilii]
MDDLLQTFAESVDASLTLEEALELIDGCDFVPNLDVDDLSVHSGSELSVQPTKPKKRVRNPLNDVQRRQRRKAERQQLKEQVQQYKALLERLKQSRQTSSSAENHVDSKLLTQQSVKSPWLFAVVREEQKRRQAEDTNARLKALLVERLETAGRVRDALMKENIRLAEIGTAKPAPGMVPSHTTVLQRTLQLCCTENYPTTSRLQAAVQDIFFATDAVFGSFPANFDSVESISRVKQQDQTSGPCIEMLTTTPLACDLQAAKSAVWEVIADEQWPAKQASFYLKTKETSQQSVVLKFSMRFESFEQNPVTLEGVTLLQRQDEAYRTVLAWTSILGCENQHFQSQGWIVVMPSPTDPHTTSVVRTCCRISANDSGNGIASPVTKTTLSSKLQNSILRSMGQRVKNRVESMQQSLVDRAGSAQGGMLIFV